MPTYQKTLTGTAQKIVEFNMQRTSLSFANRDSDDSGHISDDKGSGITRDNSWPIFPETFISIIRRDGDVTTIGTAIKGEEPEQKICSIATVVVEI